MLFFYSESDQLSPSQQACRVLVFCCPLFVLGQNLLPHAEIFWPIFSEKPFREHFEKSWTNNLKKYIKRYQIYNDEASIIERFYYTLFGSKIQENVNPEPFFLLYVICYVQIAYFSAKEFVLMLNSYFSKLLNVLLILIFIYFS